jgi:NTP pyrophosphatase (non-canonical NTP hydrolase)
MASYQVTDTDNDGHKISAEQYMRAFDQIDELVQMCHWAAHARGWWDKQRNVGEALCLIHSEISEAMEGHRRSINDEHIEHLPSIAVELADALIRIFDLAGGLRLPLGEAFALKLHYNMVRPDHERSARMQPGGKSF